MGDNIKSGIIGILLVLFAISFLTDFKISGSKTTVTPGIETQLTEVYGQFSEAYDKLDADMVTGLYEEDAYYLSGEEEIKQGHKVIRSNFDRYFTWAKGEGAHLNIEFDIVDRTVTESLVVDVAYYLITTTFPEASEREVTKSAGKFITVLRKQENGEWKFKIDGYNPAPVGAFGKG